MSLFDLPSRIDRLVLASGSPRRVELLTEMGFDPIVRPQDIDEAAALEAFANSFDEELGEDFDEEPTCEEMVRHLAECKAMSALEDETKPGDVILAADTIVAIDGEELGKPRSEEDAIEMLHALSGRTHEVSTGVCLLSPTRTGGHRSFSRPTSKPGSRSTRPEPTEFRGSAARLCVQSRATTSTWSASPWPKRCAHLRLSSERATNGKENFGSNDAG